MQEQDPFFIQHQDIKEAIEVMSGTSEIQVKFNECIGRLKQLSDDNDDLLRKMFLNNHQAREEMEILSHLKQCAKMMGYPKIFDGIVDPKLL